MQESTILGGVGSRDSLLTSITCEENMTRVTPSGGARWSGMSGKYWSLPFGRWKNRGEHRTWRESRKKNRKKTAFPGFLFKSTEQLGDNYAKYFLFTRYCHVVIIVLCLSFTHTYVFFILISE